MKKVFNQKGFSLVELLIVMGIMSVIGVVGLGHYLNFHRQVILRTAADEIVAFVRMTQERSQGQHDASQWGVRFENPAGAGVPFYASFRGPSFTTPVETRFLNRMLDFSLPADGTSIDIVFDRVSGQVTGRQFRQVHLSLISGESTRAIKVSPVGVISQDLGEIGWWRMNEGSGTTIIDSSGLGNTGTLITGASPCPGPPAGSWAPGVIGQAICLDGSDDRVDIPHADIQNTVFGTSTIFTLEAWAFPRAWVNWTAIINKADAGCWWHTTNGLWASGEGFSCVMGSGPDPICNPPGGGIRIAHSPSLNQWHHVVCTADGTNLIMFVNGAEIGRASIGAITHPRDPSIAPIVIGQRCAGCGPNFSGLIDEVRIYNRALSASEARANFNAGR